MIKLKSHIGGTCHEKISRSLAGCFFALYRRSLHPAVLAAADPGTGRSPSTQEPAAQPEAPAQEPAEPIRITPEPAGDAPHQSDAVWLDEPDTIQTDLEEIVTCTYTLPHLTLETDEASDAANAVFDTLSQTVLSYAQETVYPTAQEKQAIGYVNGGYSISEVDGTLVVDYTLSVSYSTETSDQQFTHIYTIDLSTGELLKEE